MRFYYMRQILPVMLPGDGPETCLVDFSIHFGYNLHQLYAFEPHFQVSQAITNLSRIFDYCDVGVWLDDLLDSLEIAKLAVFFAAGRNRRNCLLFDHD